MRLFPFQQLLSVMYLFCITVFISSCGKEEPTPSCNYALVNFANFNSSQNPSVEKSIFWESGTDAKKFDVTLKDNAGKIIEQKIFDSIQVINQTPYFSAHFFGLTPDTDYKVVVAAICPSNGIKSSQITTFNFKTAANCNLAAPTNFIFTNNVFSWDTVSGVNSYFLEFITEDNKTIEYYPKIESTSVGNPLFAGLKVKGRLRSLCESTNVPSELFVESQFIETKSILQNTAINGTNFPLFNASCNIIDPNVGVFENFNNKYVAIDLLNFPDNTAQTYYFRCTYGTNEYIDFPLYVEKRDGEVKVYYKSQDCSTFKNILIKEDGDHLSQKFSATSCIDIYIYPTFIELRTCLDAKIFGKKI